MKRTNAFVIAATVVAGLIGCSTASTSPTTTPPASNAVTITLGPPTQVVTQTAAGNCTRGAGPIRAEGCGTVDNDTLTCPTISANPASAVAGQSVVWFNNTGADLTLFNGSFIQRGTPIVTIPAGLTSQPVEYPAAGVYQYFSSTCVLTGTVEQYGQPGQFVPSWGIDITTVGS